MTNFPLSIDFSNYELLNWKQKSIVQEYFYLSGLSSLSEEEQDRMLEILRLAQTEQTIDFWVTEIDHIIGHKLNLIDENECKNMQAKLGEYLVIDLRNFSQITSQNTN